MRGRAVLALDTATAEAGVAVARGGELLASRGGAQQEASRALLPWIEAALAEAGVSLGGAGVVALGGPGSFTGLRVGLATVLGLHQATGVDAVALPTFQVLAAAVTAPARVLAVAPALPGEWFAQAWETAWPPRALGEPRRGRADDLGTAADGAAEAVVTASGWAAAPLAAALGLPLLVVGGLAGVAARLASLHPPSWDATTLGRPLYLAPAPATPPGPPKRVMPLAGSADGRR
jgi:tRNA threonylcarbamoyl adenosine modification protein YeaZ